MRLVGFDVETTGALEEYALQPHRAVSGQAWLTSFALAMRRPDGEIKAGGKLTPTRDDLTDFLVTAGSRGWTIVGWNTAFDVAWLIALGLREQVYACRWLDAMLLQKHLVARPDFATADGKRQRFDLETAIKTHFPGEEGFKGFTDFHSDSEEAKAGLLARNIGDASLTLRLAEKLLGEMPLAMKRNALIEARAIPLVAETYVEGLCVNTLASIRLHRKLQARRHAALTTLKILEPGITEEALASPKQLGELLFDKWSLPVVGWTEKGAQSTNKDALAELADIDERAKWVRDYRDSGNLDTKFAAAVIRSARYNGLHRGVRVVRPQARLYGTYTGRVIYSSKQGRGKQERPTGVALAQWKRDAEFRSQIVPPPGYDLLEFDFAGQEFRWMAVMSGDPTMLGLCEPGEDAHAYMGGRIARIPYEDMMRLKDTDPEIGAKRKAGKVANLSLQYRTSWRTLKLRARTDYDIKLSDIEAQAIHATYLTTYREVPRYWQRQIHKARRDGFVTTLAGRTVWLGEPTTWPQDRVWSFESTAINFPIQGVGADQKYLALCVASDYLPKVDGRFYFDLHDGLFFVVPKKYSQRAAREMKQILSNLPYEKAWGVKLPIQFPVDAKLGPSWGELKEVH